MVFWTHGKPERIWKGAGVVYSRNEHGSCSQSEQRHRKRQYRTGNAQLTSIRSNLLYCDSVDSSVSLTKAAANTQIYLVTETITKHFSSSPPSEISAENSLSQTPVQYPTNHRHAPSMQTTVSNCCCRYTASRAHKHKTHSSQISIQWKLYLFQHWVKELRSPMFLDFPKSIALRKVPKRQPLSFW